MNNHHHHHDSSSSRFSFVRDEVSELAEGGPTQDLAIIDQLVSWYRDGMVW